MSKEEPELSKVLDVKDAVDIARNYVCRLYGDEISDVLLEEVELVNKTSWNVTLSFLRLEAPLKQTVDPLAQILARGSRTYSRHYKQFLVDAKTGKVLSMKIRKHD
jgi:hypothetical protein